MSFLDFFIGFLVGAVSLLAFDYYLCVNNSYWKMIVPLVQRWLEGSSEKVVFLEKIVYRDRVFIIAPSS